MTEEEKASFYQQAKQCHTSDQLLELTMVILEKFHIEKKLTSPAGEYQPLSVYKARGYDTDKIELDCHGTEMHPVFGITYRVAIRSNADIT